MLGPLNRTADMADRRPLRSSATIVQTVFCWQPSFSGCRRQDQERTARQPRLCNILTDFSTPSKDIFVPAILLVALQ